MGTVARACIEAKPITRGEWIARRLARDPNLNPTLLGHALVAYMSDLLDGASAHASLHPELRPGCSQVEILAQLQHEGAATGLIDFTEEPMVALWFACREYPEKDGGVYVLSRADTSPLTDEYQRVVVNAFHGSGDKSVPYVWRPPNVSGRSSAQASVFVLGMPVLWPSLLWKVEIDKRSKPGLLEALHQEHGIDEGRLFDDFSGYATSNSPRRPFETARVLRFWTERVAHRPEGSSAKAQALVDLGLAHVEFGKYQQAIKDFSKTIAIDAESIEAYGNRAKAKAELRDYRGALIDYSAAIALQENGPMTDSDRERTGRMYWSRGAMYARLGEDSKRFADLNHALKLRHKMWLIEGRVTHRPEQETGYKS